MYSSTFLLGLMAFTSALAAECYGNGRHFKVDYHAVAKELCRGNTPTRMQFGSITVEAECLTPYKYPPDCEKAFENIFYQCIHFGGRNGGSWEYGEGAERQKYSLQSIGIER